MSLPHARVDGTLQPDTACYTTPPGSGSAGSPEMPVSLAGSERSVQQVASTACVSCRTSHVKCDRQNPCSRCVGLGVACTYVASRRGYNRFQPDAAKERDRRSGSSPVEKRARISEPVPPFTPATSCMEGPGNEAFSPVSPLTFLDPSSPGPAPTRGQMPATLSVPPGLNSSGHHLSLTQSRDRDGHLRSPDECTRAFYRYFHPSHPFLLPEESLSAFAGQGPIDPLFSAMRWVGSFYTGRPSNKAALFDEAYRSINNPLTPRDGFLVQAMMLLVIGLDGTGQWSRGKELLNEAKELAVQIGLHTRSFAVLNGQGVPVVEESWRRTWWELYILDGMFAGIHRVSDFTLFDLSADVALPCEEWQYASGEMPPPRYLDDLEDDCFLGDDEQGFSSLAYCILAARNLGRLLKVRPILGCNDENVERIESLLAAWRLCLPQSKRDAVGGSDEVMFKACMILHATSILLHYPLSNIDPSATAPIRSCAADQIMSRHDGLDSHTRHAIASANEISRLVSHPVPLLAHSPFFTCVVGLSCIIHLNRWGKYAVQGDGDEYFLRQRIRLNVGALSELSRVWRSAEMARDQIRGVAREIHLAKKERQTTSELWEGFLAEQMIMDVAADEAMAEVDVSRPMGESAR